MHNKSANNDKSSKNPAYVHSSSCNGISSETPQSKNRSNSYNDLELIKLQEQMLNKLREETKRKRIAIEKLKSEIEQLKQNIDPRCHVTTQDVESLKAEIRALTNKKAELEFKIRQNSGWKCKVCTVENQEDIIKCSVCGTDRDDIWMCPYCNDKNLLTSPDCKNSCDEGNIIIDWPED